MEGRDNFQDSFPHLAVYLEAIAPGAKRPKRGTPAEKVTEQASDSKAGLFDKIADHITEGQLISGHIVGLRPDVSSPFMISGPKGAVVGGGGANVQLSLIDSSCTLGSHCASF